MNTINILEVQKAAILQAMPKQLALYYGGEWHLPAGGYRPTVNPATQEELANAPEANSDDVDAAVHKAHQGFLAWARVPAAEKSAKLREIARRLRLHADELAVLDSANCGNPFKRMQPDAHLAAAQIDYYAGLVHELKGETMPTADGALNYSVREPLGVVARTACGC